MRLTTHTRLIQTTLLMILVGLVTATHPAAEQSTKKSVRTVFQQELSSHIAYASQRFDLPETWIRAVIEAESSGDPQAISHAGAMGLMQIMPVTWAELKATYALGDNPFDPRENVFAGAAYMREMYDRFGSPGFLAAYNAGPARYEEFLSSGRPLPRETRNYLAELAPIIGAPATLARRQNTRQITQDWRTAPLSVARDDASVGSGGVDASNGPTVNSERLFVPQQSGDSR